MKIKDIESIYSLCNTLIMPKRPRDANQLAKMIVDISTGESIEIPETSRAIIGRQGSIKAA